MFTAGADGCMIIYGVSARDKGRESRDLPLAYSDEILTDKQQLNDIQQKLEEAMAKNKDLSSHKTSEQDSTLAGLVQELESIIGRIKQSQNEYEDSKVRNNTSIGGLNAEQDEKMKKSLQGKANELDQMKRKHLEKHAKKSTEYSKKSIEMENLTKSQEAAMRKLLQENSNELSKQREMKNLEVENRIEELNQIKKELERKTQDQNEIVEQIKKDNETE